MIESITPCSTQCQADTHPHKRTHTHTPTGSPMGHSDTVQIKKEIDGYVNLRKVGEKVCVVFVSNIFIFV